MNDVLLKVRGAGKDFETKAGPIVAIERVGFEVAGGEFVCIVGPSGCGKSTLLMLIAGLDQPTRGELLLENKLITGSGTDRGMVFQRDCLFPWLTVRGNVEFGIGLRANKGTPSDICAARDRAHELIDVVGLSNFKDVYPKQLSGGMRQRAAIARALVHQPRVLLMDEPFGALDAQTREQMQELLLRLCDEHRTTVLFVTHDVEEAVFLADRMLVMRAHPGRIIADFPIDLPRPRRTELKLDPEFSALRGKAIAYLHTGHPPA